MESGFTSRMYRAIQNCPTLHGDRTLQYSKNDLIEVEFNADFSQDEIVATNACTDTTGIIPCNEFKSNFLSVDRDPDVDTRCKTESPVGPFQPLPRRPFVLFYGSFDNNSKRSQQQPPPASTGEVLSRHDFSQKVYFLKPTLCLHCKDYIYGNGFRGVQCKSEYHLLHLL
ncbi:unnamed protein product [Hermetia illucens]|uniref:Phorbol-ester/DAG-type domain-containing protein n=1 Tax=Hermetia illucens TaxID=343691 RepID=A0A7R8V7G0_HERIL|nr:unnamed protein product [Hermetia illucens]